MCLFFYWVPSIFCVYLWFSVAISRGVCAWVHMCVCSGVHLSWCSLIFCVCDLVSFITSGKFLAIISSNITSNTFSFAPFSSIPIAQILDHLIFHRSWVLFFLHSFPFCTLGVQSNDIYSSSLFSLCLVWQQVHWKHSSSLLPYIYFLFLHWLTLDNNFNLLCWNSCEFMHVSPYPTMAFNMLIIVTLNFLSGSSHIWVISEFGFFYCFVSWQCIFPLCLFCLSCNFWLKIKHHK